MKSVCVLGMVLLCSATFAAADDTDIPTDPDDNILGRPVGLEGDSKKEAEDLLETTLTRLATGDGPNFKATDVTNITRELMGGILYTYTTQLDNGSEIKHCIVRIWIQPWLKASAANIKIDCGDEGEVEHTWK
ncbi:hypothetical protein KR018_010946 [Drosophila ironensis]|nr:hypothetical protein KR018_010946 [Drosophila ironensis]